MIQKIVAIGDKVFTLGEAIIAVLVQGQLLLAKEIRRVWDVAGKSMGFVYAARDITVQTLC